MKTTEIKPHKSSIGGLEANIMSLIIFGAVFFISLIPYLGWIAWGVAFAVYFMEKKSKFVKFQAATALIVGIINAVISIVFTIVIAAMTRAMTLRTFEDVFEYAMGRRSASWGIITFLGVLSTIISVAFLVLYVYFIIMAIRWKQVELPIVGPLAVKASKKLDTINIGSKGAKKTTKTSKKKKTE